MTDIDNLKIIMKDGVSYKYNVRQRSWQ